MFAYLKFELRRLAREPRLFVLTMAMPVILFLAISPTIKVDNPADKPAVLRYLLIAWAAYGALIGTFSTGVGVSQERASGWLRQLRITPMPPMRVVGIKALVGMIVAVPGVIAVSVVGLTKDIHLDPSQWAKLIVFMFLGSAPFALLGLAVGFILPPQLAQAASFLVTFTLAFAGGIFVPLDNLPTALANVAKWLPSSRFFDLGYNVLEKTTPDGKGIAILAGWAVLCAVLAVLAYRKATATK